MNSNIINEINMLRLSVQKGGMTLSEYFKKVNYIRSRIDQLCNDKLEFLKYVLILNKITMDQYIYHKMRINEERLQYKRLLSFE